MTDAATTMEQFRPTLFIGLGGTGKEILLRLRRRFYQRWHVTGLPITSYLWIDTDSRDVRAQGEALDEIDRELAFGEHEKISLLDKNVGRDLSTVLRETARYEHVHQWLHPEVEQFGVEIGDGAGGVRGIGRLTLFSKFKPIEERIKKALKDIKDTPRINETKEKYLRGLEPSKMSQAYVVFSVAGGTGGGTFLDIAFLLRRLDRTDGLVQNINGLMLLPNVYFPTASDEQAMRSYGNAYAAFKELEFFTRRTAQTRADDGGFGGFNFKVNWTGQEPLSIPGPPFSVLYMCEMMNQDGFGAGNRTELFHNLAESLFLDFLPGVFSSRKRSALSNISLYLSSPQNDQVQVKDPRGRAATAAAQHGKVSVTNVPLTQSFSRRYASLGMSKIEIPVGEIREACACRLAVDVLRHVNRPLADPDLVGQLDTTTRGRFDANGLEAAFGQEWVETLGGVLAREIPAQLPAEATASLAGLRRFLDDLPRKLQKFEQDCVSAEGFNRDRWGRITTLIRNSTVGTTEKVKADLQFWISEAMEKPELGLNALRGDGRLIALLRDRLRQLFSVEPKECLQRAEQARQDADYYRARRDGALTELRSAVDDRGIRLLGLREWTVRTLYDRVRDAAEQHAKAKAASYLAEETAKVAAAADEFLREQAKRLDSFAEGLARLDTYFANLESQFKRVSRTDLSVTLLAEGDFDRFYRLDFDDTTGAHHPISPPAEHERFLRFAQIDRTRPLGLIERYERQTEAWLKTTLRTYTAERFREDVDACLADPVRHRNCGRLTAVLEHPLMKADPAERIERLVRGALPMLRRDSDFAGVAIQEQKRAILGLPAVEIEPYESFRRRVVDRLNALDFRDVEALPTDNPTAIHLFLEVYAFPLGAAPLVTEDCHKQYYQFYRTHRGGRGAQRIPLHLDLAWEGEFDDLRTIQQDEAQPLLEALAIQALGPILKVVSAQIVEGRREFGYWVWLPPVNRLQALGRRRETAEFLLREPALRAELLRAIEARRASFESPAAGSPKTGLLDYFWSLTYLHTAVFTSDSPERTIVERERERVGNMLVSGEDYPDLSSLGEHQLALEARRRLEGRVDWTNDYPAIQSLVPYVKGRPDMAAKPAAVS